MKNDQIRSFFWSIFSRISLHTQIDSLNIQIQFKYEEKRTRKKLRICALFTQCCGIEFLFDMNEFL